METYDLGIDGLGPCVIAGGGGSATVYAGFHDKYGRVAIKVLRLSPQADKLHARELSVLRGIPVHPNIVRVLETTTTAMGEQAIVMPLLEGSVQDRLDQHPLDWVEAAQLSHVVARSLQHLHDHNVLHRDIKPSNILTDETGRPLLSDFGIAKLTSDTAVTTTALAMSPSYSAPERLQGQPGTEASDVYSLGATLVALLTGRAPFATGESDTPLSIALRASDKSATLDLSGVRAPRALKALALQAMSHESEARPASAAVFADRVAEILHDEDLSTNTADLTIQIKRDQLDLPVVVPSVPIDGTTDPWRPVADDPPPTTLLPVTSLSQDSANQAVTHLPSPQPQPAAQPKRSKAPLAIAVALLLLAGAGAAVFGLFSGNGDDDTIVVNSPTVTANDPQQGNGDEPPADPDSPAAQATADALVLLAEQSATPTTEPTAGVPAAALTPSVAPTPATPAATAVPPTATAVPATATAVPTPSPGCPTGFSGPVDGNCTRRIAALETPGETVTSCETGTLESEQCVMQVAAVAGPPGCPAEDGVVADGTRCFVLVPGDTTLDPCVAGWVTFDTKCTALNDGSDAETQRAYDCPAAPAGIAVQRNFVQVGESPQVASCEYDKPAVTTCPADTTVDGTSCREEVATVPTTICPEGFTKVDDLCERSEPPVTMTEPSTFACPDGTTGSPSSDDPFCTEATPAT